LERGGLQLVERPAGGEGAVLGQVGYLPRVAADDWVPLVVDDPVVGGVAEHGRARQGGLIGRGELCDVPVGGGRVLARQVVALVLVDHAEVTDGRAGQPIGAGAQRRDGQPAAPDRGVGDGEERRALQSSGLPGRPFTPPRAPPKSRVSWPRRWK
jgi:hypothetical protein